VLSALTTSAKNKDKTSPSSEPLPSQKISNCNSLKTPPSDSSTASKKCTLHSTSAITIKSISKKENPPSTASLPEDTAKNKSTITPTEIDLTNQNDLQCIPLNTIYTLFQQPFILQTLNKLRLNLWQIFNPEFDPEFF
jgi:hypothetical protein